MLDTKKITIFGCGWLGFPLAQRLIEKGYSVLGTTTREAKLAVLESVGIKAFKIDLTDDALSPLIFQSEILILAFPPKLRSTDGEWYVQAVRRIVTAANPSTVKKLILISSTSVYPDVDEVMTEDYPLSTSNSANAILIEAEQTVLGSTIEAVILRLGGLAGDDRWLARHFSGKYNLPNGKSPVNLLHKEDALKCIELSIESEVPVGIYNVCSPVHPTKEELYTKECKKAGWPVPHYNRQEPEGGKVISVDKWLRAAGYQFLFPSPLDYTYAK